jgi:hypothetical protein
MKRYLCLLVCVLICIALLSGCSNNGCSVSAAGTENTLAETSLDRQNTNDDDWEATSYLNVNNFDGVTMTVKEGSVSSAGLILMFKNNSSSQCIYGEYFSLEKQIDEIWYQVPVVIDGNYAFNSIGYNLDSGSDSEWSVDWEWLYGSLSAGKYRIVKNISDFRGTGDFDTYYLTAEFMID